MNRKNKRYNIFKNIFGFALLFTNGVWAKSVPALSQERQRELRNEGVQTINIDTIVMDKLRDVNLYTQSQAHLRLSNVRKILKEKYGNKVVPFFDIISSALVKEAELKNSHYAFYHAAPSITAVLSDLYTQLYFYFNPNEKPTNDDTFRFLRFMGEAKDTTPQEFLKEELSKNGLVDDSGELAAYLLSVNLAIFGNMGSSTECTWHWFVNNARSIPKPDLCQKIMDKFGLSHKYVDEILALDNLLAMPETTLLQIFIPRDIVDDLVYLAWIRGVPATGPIMDWIKKYQKTGEKVPKRDRPTLEHTSITRTVLAEKFKTEKEKNPLFRDFMKGLESGDWSVDAFLTAYCNEPLKDPNINETEGRILFTQEGLLNPASGIRFYRYLTTPREKVVEYTKKLNAIVEKLIAEKESGASAQVKQATQPKPAAGKQLAPTVTKPATGKNVTKGR